jgi:hypothetical protein
MMVAVIWIGVLGTHLISFGPSANYDHTASTKNNPEQVDRNQVQGQL